MPTSTKYIDALTQIATTALPDFSVLFGSWDDVDRMLDRAHYPAVLNILSVSGGGTYRNGRVYDYQDMLIAFADKVPRDASGEENFETAERMRTAMKKFIKQLNSDGRFIPVEQYNYTLNYEQRANIDTACVLEIRLIDAVGECV